MLAAIGNAEIVLLLVVGIVNVAVLVGVIALGVRIGTRPRRAARAERVPSHVPLVGVGVVIVRDGAWLLMRRANAHGEGTWSTPGGHLEHGEDPAVCARREAEEETGLRVAETRFAGVTNDVFDDGRHYVTLWFEATRFDGEATLSAPREMSELRWFAREAFPDPLFPPLRRLLDGELLGPGLAGPRV